MIDIGIAESATILVIVIATVGAYRLLELNVHWGNGYYNKTLEPLVDGAIADLQDGRFKLYEGNKPTTFEELSWGIFGNSPFYNYLEFDSGLVIRFSPQQVRSTWQLTTPDKKETKFLGYVLSKRLQKVLKTKYKEAQLNMRTL